MVDRHDHGSNSNRLTQSSRRSYLTAAGALATTALAGCLGGGSGTPDTSYECELAAGDEVSELPQPTLGPSDATVTVDVFEDFACPHCADFSLNILSDVRANYIDDGEDVRIRHFDYPVPVNEWSRPVANAARYVQDQHGDAAFYAFSTLAYENQADYSWQVVGDLTTDLEADTDPCGVLSAASAGTYSKVIDDDRFTGDDRGVAGTPTVFVNGELVDRNYGAIAGAIDAALSA